MTAGLHKEKQPELRKILGKSIKENGEPAGEMQEAGISKRWKTEISGNRK